VARVIGLFAAAVIAFTVMLATIVGSVSHSPLRAFAFIIRQVFLTGLPDLGSVNVIFRGVRFSPMTLPTCFVSCSRLLQSTDATASY